MIRETISALGRANGLYPVGLMGGRGSGGHNSKGKLRDVQCARLDVHELAREGKLKLGGHGWLFGAIWFEVTGGPDAQHLVLEFPWRSASGEQWA